MLSKRPCRRRRRRQSQGVLLHVLSLCLASPLAATIEIRCPEAVQGEANQADAQIYVDAADRTLGAYTVALSFDRNDVRVRSVVGGATREFSGVPTHNAQDFQSGNLRLSAFNSSSLSSPKGSAHVATVNLELLTKSEVELRATTVRLADTAGAPIKSESDTCIINPGALGCPGDCDASGDVTIEELIRGVNIALSRMDISQCRVFDADEDGRITIDEIVSAVRMSLDGCARQP